MKIDDKHLMILLMVRNAGRSNDLAPSVSDLQKATLLSAGGVQMKINELRDYGYITRSRLARSIRITEKGKQYLDIAGMK